MISAFTAVHAFFFALLLPIILTGSAYDDVMFYRQWAFQGIRDGIWQGIDTPWVYPVGAMLPMLVSAVLGPHLYMLSWLVLCTLLNIGAVMMLLNRSEARHRWQAAYLWIGFTAILGPLAFSRIDGIAGPLVVVGLLFVMERPLLASAVLSMAAWIKVWPAAPVLALLITSRAKLRVLLAGVGVSVAIAAVVVLMGGARNLFGFVAAQGERGMQLEASMSTPALWQAVLGLGGHVHQNVGLNTNEVRGSLADAATYLTDPLLGLSLVVTAALIVVAMRRGADDEEVLMVGTLALVAAMIVFNKVGSPQFMIWLSSVIAVGTARRGRQWVLPATLMVLTCVLTTFVYPFHYGALIGLNGWVALCISVRNVLVVVIFCWAIRQLVQLAAANRSKLRGSRPPGRVLRGARWDIA